MASSGREREASFSVSSERTVAAMAFPSMSLAVMVSSDSDAVVDVVDVDLEKIIEGCR